jgi:hypothetical protein
MRGLRLFLLGATSLMGGCGVLGFHRYASADRAPPEESAKVRFPSSFENGSHLSGAKLAAIRVAMEEFLPPGKKLTGDNPQLAQCLSRWETYDVSVLQSQEDVFFVRFFPVISRCGLDVTVLDAGAVYAVDARGRILAQE